MKRYRLTSSCRVEYVDFATIAEAENFLANRKLSQEGVSLIDKLSGDTVFCRNYD